MKEHINKWAAANCWDQMVFNHKLSKLKVVQVLTALSDFSLKVTSASEGSGELLTWHWILKIILEKITEAVDPEAKFPW